MDNVPSCKFCQNLLPLTQPSHAPAPFASSSDVRAAASDSTCLKKDLVSLRSMNYSQQRPALRIAFARRGQVVRAVFTPGSRALCYQLVYDEESCTRSATLGLTSKPMERVCSTFYERVREVKDFHRRYPDGSFTQKEDFTAGITEEPWVDFTGEESHGRCLDLHDLYHEFVNSKFGRQMEYFEYLQVVSEFNVISRGLRMTKAYRQYIDNLFEYLKGFHEKTQPLTHLPKILAQCDAEFEEQWEAGEVEGWEEKGAGVTGYVDATIDLDAYNSPEEVLQGVDMETIKTALQSLGMKTGGTPLQRAERLFRTKGVALESLDHKLFVKGAAPVANDEERAAKQMERAKELAHAEARTICLLDKLSEAVQNTIDNVEKKLTRTQAELIADQEEDEYVEEEDEDEEEPIYNPLKLPMGWDGKPIPYWLYKLHGLNQVGFAVSADRFARTDVFWDNTRHTYQNALVW